MADKKQDKYINQLGVFNTRQCYEQIRAQLAIERSPYEPEWRDIACNISPQRDRFNVTDTNKRRKSKIIDSTGTFSSTVLRSGMTSGISNAARPWFRITVEDPALREYAPVKEWLFQVSEILRSIFIRSNFYKNVPIVYGDMGDFGTAALLIEEDWEYTIRTTQMPIGSYWISNNANGQADTFIRDLQMTVRQIVEKFGWDREKGEIDWSNISDQVRNLWDRGMLETWIQVCHVIMPNPEYDPNRLMARFNKYVSTYYERCFFTNGGGYAINDKSNEKILRISGYDYFPVLCPRWEVTGEDSWGSRCPGMTALGDVRALQLMQKRKAQAVEKMVNPPMIAPSEMQNRKTSILAGDVVFSNKEGMRGFRPAHEVQPRVNELMLDIQDNRGLIRRAYFEDVFLAITNLQRDATAREIDERAQEKLISLGPVFENVSQDMLDPSISITFQMGLKQNKFPKPPDVLQGRDLKVEYISIMAQAQKLLGTQSIERFVGFTNQLVELYPEAKDKIDARQIVDIYGDQLGIQPGAIRTDEAVQKIDAQKQAAAQAAARQQAMVENSAAVKNLSQSNLDQNSVLKQMTENSQATPGLTN